MDKKVQKNKLNYYKRVLIIQQIYTENNAQGRSNVWIHANIIYPRFLIGISTFYTYLTINAKAEIKKIEND
ncbi:hypothetical protein [uncultured Mucilaginibacter sp.]|uniref:hypothetical protein n=1 Tax=uncultured Mucilaginibacter sp. TaxID=797541 RepID=UPI0025F366AD|nr:hypothetical protein [uncultured Mucilaginibacter sp.]